MSQVIYEGSYQYNDNSLGVDTDFNEFVAFGIGDEEGRLTARLVPREVFELIGQLYLWLQRPEVQQGLAFQVPAREEGKYL